MPYIQGVQFASINIGVINNIVPFSFIPITDNTITYDPITRSFTFNESGIYLVIYNLHLQNIVDPSNTTPGGAAYSIRINGVEQANTIYVTQTPMNDTTPYHLIGQALITINQGDVVILLNTGSTDHTLIPSGDGQAGIAASMLFFKISNSPSN